MIAQGLPKAGLLIVIPGYILLAWWFYTGFKNSSKAK
jgi:hypothetical protein